MDPHCHYFGHTFVASSSLLALFWVCCSTKLGSFAAFLFGAEQVVCSRFSGLNKKKKKTLRTKTKQQDTNKS